MCGIVGMAGDLTNNDKKAFRDLLTVCQVRGRDSTGAIRLDGQNKYSYIKRVGTPEFLLDTKGYDKEIEGGTANALIGHCRAKTFGSVSTQNAHPFSHGHICGVHNGTLSMCYSLPRFRDFDVDSDWLYWHISEYGIEETIPLLSGAWALVWVDEKQKTLNFIRNDQRSLYLSHSEDMKKMIWASEPWMFGAAQRHGIKLWDGGEEKTPIYPLPVNQLYSYELNGYGKTPQEIFKMKPPVELKEEVRGYTGNHRGSVGTSSVSSNVVHITRGGEVADPFLDDTLEDLQGKSNEGKAQLPALLDTSKIADELKDTSSGGDISSSSSRSPLDPSTDSQSSSPIAKQNHYPPRQTSKSFQQVVKERLLGRSIPATPICVSQQKSDQKPLTSRRTIAGLHFITDMKTGREFSEERFETETNALCTYCKHPIGGLEHVEEIFVKWDGKTNKECVSFLCNSCSEPAIA